MAYNDDALTNGRGFLAEEFPTDSSLREDVPVPEKLRLGYTAVSDQREGEPVPEGHVLYNRKVYTMCGEKVQIAINHACCKDAAEGAKFLLAYARFLITFACLEHEADLSDSLQTGDVLMTKVSLGKKYAEKIEEREITLARAPGDANILTKAERALANLVLSRSKIVNMMVGVIKVNMCTLHKEGHHYKDDILDRSNKIAASIGLDLAMKDFELGKSDKAAMRYLFRTATHHVLGVKKKSTLEATTMVKKHQMQMFWVGTRERKERSCCCHSRRKPL
jgi:hypothetical protein